MGKPDPDWDDLPGSTGFGELFRYKRGAETRIYSLRVVPGGAELWRLTESPGDEPVSLKECHFNDADEALELLEEVRRSLIAGGWKEDG